MLFAKVKDMPMTPVGVNEEEELSLVSYYLTMLRGHMDEPEMVIKMLVHQWMLSDMVGRWYFDVAMTATRDLETCNIFELGGLSAEIETRINP